jgi:hypothetical protein
MKTEQTSFLQKIISRNLILRALQGAVLAPCLFFLLVLMVTGGKIESWIFAPLLSVMVGGAIGGIVFYLVDPWHYQGGKRLAATIFCILFFIASGFFSLIPGLAYVGVWD